MKTSYLSGILLFLIFSTSGCFTYTSHRTPETVVVTQPSLSSQQIITTLPVGYKVYVSHGVIYYRYNNVYYQTANLQNGKTGYVIVTQPQ